MAEKEINERRRGLLKRVLESKTLNRTLKTVVLSAFLSGKAMSSKAVEPQVKDAAVDAVEQKTEAMPSQQLSENYAKLQKFADFPELSPAQAALSIIPTSWTTISGSNATALRSKRGQPLCAGFVADGRCLRAGVQSATEKANRARTAIFRFGAIRA